MAYSALATQTSSDLDSAANINQLQENIRALKDGEVRMTAEIIPYAGISAPSGWFLCTGASKSRATYSDLWAALSEDKGSFTVTIASPGVVTLAGHGLSTGHCVSLTTDGALPTGLSADTNYYVIYVSADTFQLATSLANAIAGTPINTSGSQSGTHNLTFNPWGIDTGSNFLLPNLQGVVLKGAGSQSINGRTKTGPVLGAVEEDQGQAFQVGTTNDGTGDRNYYGTGNDRDYAASQASAANHSTPRFMTTTQGDARMMKAVNDGTNGDPRTGATTRENSVGVNYIIKY